jgi:hypothetical protein
VQNIQNHESLPPSPPTPTHTEQEWIAEEIDRREAFEMIQARHNYFLEAQQRFDDFNIFYTEERRRFLKQKVAGLIDATTTEFDSHMVFEGQHATQELIHAEEDLQLAKDHAKGLGVVFDPSTQESNFLDRVDDGYRESLEAAIVAEVDRNWILKWMHEDTENRKQLIEYDEWDAKTVDLCDSVSMVAEGKERVRIDGWKRKCEIIHIEIGREQKVMKPEA